MREGGGGRIIAISSLGSRFAVPDYSGLGAAKAVIETLAQVPRGRAGAVGHQRERRLRRLRRHASMRLAADYRELTEHLVAKTPAGRLATARRPRRDRGVSLLTRLGLDPGPDAGRRRRLLRRPSHAGHDDDALEIRRSRRRWSPAARVGSAARSPSSSHARAPAWSSTTCAPRSEAEAVVEEITSSGGDAHAVPGGRRDEAEVKELVRFAVRRSAASTCSSPTQERCRISSWG